MDNVRLCEWSSVRVPGASDEWRRQVEEASVAWRQENRLSDLPLKWEGTDGRTLRARQWAGVVQVGGVAIEIFPKLDAQILDQDTPNGNTETVLKSLLWMMEAAGYGHALEAGQAALDSAPLSLADVWALLLARALRRELQSGLAHAYHGREEATPAVRGRIQIAQQVSRHWNRMDRIACAWDEWTPDTPLNRTLRAACRLLSRRVSSSAVAAMLFDCLFLLDEAADVAPSIALHESERLVHTRATERFRLSFSLARRILAGSGPALGAGGDETWVFLLDMNTLFESFCHAVLEARFGVPVDEQKYFSHTLLKLSKGGIRQKPDFRWRERGGPVWIGDAKYKHLAKNGRDSLQFADAEVVNENDTSTRAGKFLSPDDVRQMGVYAELERKAHGGELPEMMLLYPFVGSGRFEVSRCEMWNGATLTLAPVRVRQQENLAACLPK